MIRMSLLPLCRNNLVPYTNNHSPRWSTLLDTCTCVRNNHRKRSYFFHFQHRTAFLRYISSFRQGVLCYIHRSIFLS